MAAIYDSDDDDDGYIGPVRAPSAYPTYIAPSPKPYSQEDIFVKLNALGPPSAAEKQIALEIIAASKIRDFTKKYELLIRAPSPVQALYTNRELLVEEETGIKFYGDNFQIPLTILENYYNTHAGGRRSKTRKGKGKRKHRKSKTAKRRARR